MPTYKYRRQEGHEFECETRPTHKPIKGTLALGVN